MKFSIPKKCHIRWQAALAVLEDLQEDLAAPFDMRRWADSETLWEKTNGCGSPACFAGYISVSPYCLALGGPDWTRDCQVVDWLTNATSKVRTDQGSRLYRELFSSRIDNGSRAKTLEYLERRLKAIFKKSTGKRLVAPLTFYI